MSFIPLSLHPTQSLSPCPWPLWMAQIVAKMHISRPNDPPGFFIPTPTSTKCIQSTPHTIPLHENVIHSSLPSSHPISEPSSLAPLNGSNSSKNAYFQTQWPSGFFYTNPYPNQMYPVKFPHHPPTLKCHSFLSPFAPPNLWALVLDLSEWLK